MKEFLFWLPFEFMSPALEVTEEEMNSLTQSILTRYGIDFTCYEPKSLRRRIIRVMNLLNIPSVHDLWVQFLRDTKFIQIFMNEISVGMTSMFRDPLLWKSLKSELKSVFNSKGISIWHSGCSTGEEVYSMGILLEELGFNKNSKALATDINLRAIDEAKAGRYHKIKMIENETNFKEFNAFLNFDRYFVQDGQYVNMNSSLISHVEFKYHNLITDPYPSGFDIILCRNVMIYFDNIAKRKVLDGFYDSLKPGGYLVIGYFDSLTNLIDNSKFLPLSGETRIFRKN